MTYFTEEDHKAVLTVLDTPAHPTLERTHKRLHDLHRRLYSRIRQYNLLLTPHPEESEGLSNHTNSSPVHAHTLTLMYTRPPAESLTVERIMGRETVHHTETHIYLHPAIELRLMPEHFVVELVVAPDARYDQQNFVGKLTLQQHRETFYRLLSDLGSGYLLGFWSGAHLDSLHMDTDQLPPMRILFEYMDTFAAGRDYFRLGRWYEIGDDTLTEDAILDEAFQRLRQLYAVYDFMRWTSDNNFHSFYKKAVTR